MAVRKVIPGRKRAVMLKPGERNPSTPGRKPAVISPADEALAHQLATEGATDGEIAGSLGIAQARLADYKSAREGLRDAIDRGRREWTISLRRAQTLLAREGNATLLIWLGKNALGQTDRVDVGVGPSQSLEELLVSLDQRRAGLAAGQGQSPGLTIEGKADPEIKRDQ